MDILVSNTTSITFWVPLAHDKPILPPICSFIGIILLACQILQKTNISYPLISTRTSVYQGVRTISFLQHFAYVLNE